VKWQRKAVEAAKACSPQRKLWGKKADIKIKPRGAKEIPQQNRRSSPL